jgi:FkbM family methyltransferase
MNIKRLIGKCGSSLDLLRLKALPSYSQAGEDMIVNYLLGSIGVKNPTYLEIGTNLPDRGNNTFYFYRRGFRGVCIEPDASLCELIRKVRPGDKLLNIGVGLTQDSSANFYIFPGYHHSWNTFSAEDAAAKEKESGFKARQVQVPLRTINSIIEENFESYPNFISLDVEGWDLAILKSMDLDKYRPEVFCVETISFSTQHKEVKMQDTIDYMHSKGYFSYADTHINTIFCKSELFLR